MKIIDQTPFQFSGVTWTIFDHILVLIVIGITVHIVSKKQKNENYRFIQSVYVAVILILYSLIIELTIPIKLIVFSLPVTFAVATTLSKFVCDLSWKKATIMGATIFVVSIVVGVFEAILFTIIKLTT